MAVVHVIHLVDGAFPSDMALSTAAGLVEEQRLFYVAVTRARDELSLYTPLRMPHHRRARDDSTATRRPADSSTTRPWPPWTSRTPPPRQAPRRRGTRAGGPADAGRTLGLTSRPADQ